MVVKDPIEAIRLKCLECNCGQRKFVEECQIRDCALYRFRRGTNPFTDGTYEVERAAEIEQARKERSAKKAVERAKKKEAEKAKKEANKFAAKIQKISMEEGKITVNKDGIGKRIEKAELKSYIDKGWKIGTSKSK